MTTAYTAIFEDKEDATAKEYIYRCSRAFLYHTREESLKNTLPEKIQPELDKTRDGKIKNLKAFVKSLSSMTLEEEIKLGEDSTNKKKQELADRIKENKRLINQHNKIKAEVEAWDVSEELVGLRKFALDQIRLSQPLEIPYYEKQFNSPEEEFRAILKLARNELEYWKNSFDKDIENAKIANDWIDKLEQEASKL